MIFGRLPAFWIGLIGTLIVGALSTLTSQGLVSEALAGKITDTVNAIAQLLSILAPLIAGLVIHTQVTPVKAPSLPVGTVVTTPTGTGTVTPTP